MKIKHEIVESFDHLYKQYCNNIILWMFIMIAIIKLIKSYTGYNTSVNVQNFDVALPTSMVGKVMHVISLYMYFLE